MYLRIVRVKGRNKTDVDKREMIFFFSAQSRRLIVKRSRSSNDLEKAVLFLTSQATSRVGM